MDRPSVVASPRFAASRSSRVAVVVRLRAFAMLVTPFQGWIHQLRVYPGLRSRCSLQPGLSRAGLSGLLNRSRKPAHGCVRPSRTDRSSGSGSALKGRHVIAQGEALGYDTTRLPSPVRAKHSTQRIPDVQSHTYRSSTGLPFFSQNRRNSVWKSSCLWWSG